MTAVALVHDRNILVSLRYVTNASAIFVSVLTFEPQFAPKELEAGTRTPQIGL
jgi:hypothetical protein